MKALHTLGVWCLFHHLWNGLHPVESNSQECGATEGGDDASCRATQSTDDCKDGEPDTCTKRRHECDSDPSYMLFHCRKTCQVCLQDGSTTMQDAGFGRIPLEVSIQVLQVARQTNLYYQTLSIPEYSLVSFRDKSEMCAFWAFQEQCTNPEYRNFMDRECPVTCRHCELLQAQAFVHFLHDLKQAYDSEKDNVLASRKASFTLLLKRLGMDTSLISKPIDNEDSNNWVNELHSRLLAVIPPALLRLYDTPQGPISDKDLELLTALHGFSVDTPRDIVLTNTLVQYRSRGYIVSIMRDIDHLITRPIQLLVGFTIPNDAAIERLKEVSPLLYMGAGSGYFAGILQQHGVDVLAYDLHPPSTQDNSNLFFEKAYIDNIREGACVESMTPELAEDRALLLVWPNDPDPIDNREFCQDDGCKGSEAVWDADCLESYLQAGGHRVVFIGERSDAIRGDSTADCGLSATRRFQAMLKDKFALVDTIRIPNWWLNEDDMTIWERK